MFEESKRTTMGGIPIDGKLFAASEGRIMSPQEPKTAGQVKEIIRQHKGCRERGGETPINSLDDFKRIILDEPNQMSKESKTIGQKCLLEKPFPFGEHIECGLCPLRQKTSKDKFECVRCTQCREQIRQQLIDWLNEPCVHTAWNTEFDAKLHHKDDAGLPCYLHRKDCPKCWQQFKEGK